MTVGGAAIAGAVAGAALTAGIKVTKALKEEETELDNQ